MGDVIRFPVGRLAWPAYLETRDLVQRYIRTVDSSLDRPDVQLRLSILDDEIAHRDRLGQITDADWGL